MQDIWRLVLAPNPVLDDVVREQLLVQSAQASRLTSLLGFPLILLAGGVLLASDAAPGEVAVWSALALAVMAVYQPGLQVLVVPPARRSYRARLRIFTGFQALAGLAWGCASIIITPVTGQPALVALPGAIATLCAAANVIFSSATRDPWLAFHVTVIGSASAGLVAHGQGAIAFLNVITFLGAVPLARYTYQQVAQARLVARHNELLAGDLRAEREAVERINLQLSEANSELRHQATRDPLTRLPNRTLFFDHLERSMRHGRRNATPVAVIFFDLDRFKAVNDSLGHGAGDDLLCQVAERVTAVLRSPDVLARLGGDEFVVLTHDFEGQAEGNQYAPALVAERVRQVLAVPFDLSGNPVTISSSVGVAVDENGLTGERLVERADLALYRAKELGRNRVAVFHPEMMPAVVPGPAGQTGPPRSTGLLP